MEFNNDLIPKTNNDQSIGSATLALKDVYFSNPSGVVKKLVVDANNKLEIGGTAVIDDGDIQTTLTDDDAKVPSSGAIVDYAVDLARIQTTLTDSAVKVPSSSAIFDYALPLAGSSAITGDLALTTSGDKSLGTTTKGWKYLYLKDTATATVYKLQVTSGVFSIEEI